MTRDSSFGREGCASASRAAQAPRPWYLPFRVCPLPWPTRVPRFRFLPDILRNQTHLDFENCAADTVLRKIANALHSGTGARLRSRILLIHSLPLHPWPHSRTSSREFRGGLQVLAACIHLLGLKVQRLLTVVPTVIAQISLLSYMGGDHYVAAVRKRERAVLIFGRPHLHHQSSRHKER